jgi:hypothetical protein
VRKEEYVQPWLRKMVRKNAFGVYFVFKKIAVLTKMPLVETPLLVGTAHDHGLRLRLLRVTHAR